MKKLFVLFLLLVGIGLSQQVTIDGSTNPQGIPDAAAIQAVLGTHSNFKSAAAISNTEKLHAKIGFSAADHATYDSAMQGLFNAKRQPWAQTYSNLMQSLSADGQSKLKAFVQSEKAHMQYHIQEPIAQEMYQ